jgi:hypothetical protein
MARGRGPWHGASPARGRGQPGGGHACQRPYIKRPQPTNPNPPTILGLSLSTTAAQVPTLIPCLASLRRRSVPPAVDSSVLAGGSAVLVTCVLTRQRIWSPVSGPWCIYRIFLAGDPVTFFLLLIPLPRECMLEAPSLSLPLPVESHHCLSPPSSGHLCKYLSKTVKKLVSGWPVAQ